LSTPFLKKIKKLFRISPEALKNKGLQGLKKYSKRIPAAALEAKKPGKTENKTENKQKARKNKTSLKRVKTDSTV